MAPAAAMTTDSLAMLDTSFMQLMWLASPALPIGGFSYSDGLEAAVDAQYAASEADARTWLLDQLHGAQHVGQHVVGFDLQVIRL